MPAQQPRHPACPPLPPCTADFACGVVSAGGEHVLLREGSLPTAVSASAAIPLVFAPVAVPGRLDGPFIDGGIRCRIGLDLWRRHRHGDAPTTAPPAVVHLIGRSSPFSGNDSTAGLGGWLRAADCCRPCPHRRLPACLCLGATLPLGEPAGAALVLPVFAMKFTTSFRPPVPAAGQNAAVVKSPKSGVSFFSYGDYEGQFEAARQRSLPVLRALLEDDAPSGGAGSGAALPSGSSSSSAGSGRLAAAASS